MSTVIHRALIEKTTAALSSQGISGLPQYTKIQRAVHVSQTIPTQIRVAALSVTPTVFVLSN
jgi:hypothetical protein